MKRTLSVILIMTLVIGLLPTSVFASHEHCYDFISGYRGKHPHGAFVECDCGEEIFTGTSYDYDCYECQEELCFEYDVHFYDSFIEEDDGSIEAECICGDVLFFDDEEEWELFYDDHRLEVLYFCEELTLELAAEAEEGYTTSDIDSLFSKSAKKAHPHEGFYETRDGEEVFLDKAYDPECILCIEELCYEYDAHSCLYECEPKAFGYRFTCFCGKSKKVNFNEVENFLSKREETTRNICEDINYDLADDAFYASDSVFDNYSPYSREEDEEVEDFAESTLSGSFDSPQIHTRGVEYELEGSLHSNYPITFVYMYITNSNGSIVMDSMVEPYTTNFEIDSSCALNRELRFEKLNAGKYNLSYQIEDASGVCSNGSVPFEIIESGYCEPTPEDPTIIISFTSAPAVVRESYFDLRGSVNSDYPLTEVRGYIKDRRGNTLLTSYDAPYSEWMDIRTANLNNNLTFGKLPNGNYTMLVTAKDTSGATADLQFDFSVERPTVTPASKGENGLSAQEWNEKYSDIIIDPNYSQEDYSNLPIATNDIVDIDAIMEQAILGNYSKSFSAEGVIAEVVLGLFGIDIWKDFTDLTWDIWNFEFTNDHLLQTGLDLLAFFPVLGVGKSCDEIGLIKKAASKFDIIKAVSRADIKRLMLLKDGHTISKHVGNFDDIALGLLRKGNKNISSFYTEKDAIDVVSKALSENASAIANKLASQTTGFAVTVDMGYGIGRGMFNGSSVSKEVTRAKVIIQPDGDSFYIKTAFPIE